MALADDARRKLEGAARDAEGYGDNRNVASGLAAVAWAIVYLADKLVASR